MLEPTTQAPNQFYFFDCDPDGVDVVVTVAEFNELAFGRVYIDGVLCLVNVEFEDTGDWSATLVFAGLISIDNGAVIFHGALSLGATSSCDPNTLSKTEANRYSVTRSLVAHYSADMFAELGRLLDLFSATGDLDDTHCVKKTSAITSSKESATPHSEHGGEE